MHDLAIGMNSDIAEIDSLTEILKEKHESVKDGGDITDNEEYQLVGVLK